MNLEVPPAMAPHRPFRSIADTVPSVLIFPSTSPSLYPFFEFIWKNGDSENVLVDS
jgi:hypothetical protein